MNSKLIKSILRPKKHKIYFTASEIYLLIIFQKLNKKNICIIL